MRDEIDSAEAPRKDLSADAAELSELAGSLAGSIRRRLILWVVRWVLGFTAIAVAVQWRQSLSWLWWVGAIVAFISLVMLITLHAVSRRRVEFAQQRLAEHEDSFGHPRDDSFRHPRAGGDPSLFS
jgi:hypothetical protein